MGGLFGGGGGQNINNSAPIISSLRLQTAVRGRPIPLVYGKTRVAANLIWYSDFTAIPHTTTQSSGGGGGKGGGGGGGTTTNTTYTYTTAVILALCEGAVNAIPRIWADKDVYQGATAASQTFTVQDETYSLPGYANDGQSRSVTVVNAAALSGTPQVFVNNASDEWGWGGRKQLVQGTDYARSGGMFTFIPAYSGSQVFITYDYAITNYPQDACAQLNLSLFTGTYSQGNWGWLQTNHPNEALSYRGLTYAAGAAYDLGDNAQMPNHSFEIDTQSAYSLAIRDANPKDVVYDLLTNPYYGVGFPLQKIADWANWSRYCVSNNIFVSPAYTEQNAASAMLQTMMQLTNSGCVYSEGVLKIIPYGDVASTANGVTYTPNLTPVYDLSDDDFLGEGSDPIKITRSTNADAYNQVQVKFYNRDNQYNEEIAEAKDQANIELFGLRTIDPIDLKEVALTASARAIAQLILQRALYIRNTYEFRLGWKYALLEPMDLVTLTDPALGLNKTPVRIIEIEEDKYGELVIKAEEFPLNVCSTALYASQNTAGYSINFNADPGNVTTPTFLEPPLTDSSLYIATAVSGADPDWGGCYVYASLDNSTYKRVGVVSGGARYGTLTSAIGAADTTMTVSLIGKGGQLLSGTALDAQLMTTACWINGEYISYTTATLVSANVYTLSGCIRGGWGSAAVAHAAGESFVRVDDGVVKGDPLDSTYVGKTVWFKFTSFNVVGGGLQDISTVTAYPYVLQGTSLAGSLPNVQNLNTVLRNGSLYLTWSAVNDPRLLDYEIRKGSLWRTAQVLGRTTNLELLVSGDDTYWVAARSAYNYSTTPSSIVVEGANSLVKNVVVTFDESSSGWTGVLTDGACRSTDGISLAGADAFSGIPVVSAVPSVLFYKTASPYGTYELPASHVVNLGKVQECYVQTAYSMRLDDPYRPFSTIPLLSAVSSLIGEYSSGGSLSVEMATAQADGVYGDWRPYTPGNYVAQFIKFRLVLTSTNPYITPVVTQFSVSVDVPDRVDTGTAVNCPITGLAVVYVPQFTAAPNVQITILNAQAGDDIVLVSQDAAGFFVQIINGGSSVNRSINWLAQGY